MAGASVDLTGNLIGDWTVAMKAPAQARVRFWTVGHEPCGQRVDLPQTLLQAAIKGKSTLPPCVACTPAEALPGVSHGMHVACGSVHLIGTKCPDGINRESGSALTTDYPPYAGPVVTEAYSVERIAPTSTTPGGTVLRPDPYEPKVLIQGTPQAVCGRVSVWESFDPQAADDAEPPVIPTARPGFQFAEPLPVEHAAIDAAATQAHAADFAWSLYDSEAPPAVRNAEYRDVLLAPMRRAMASHERNAQVKPGPSSIGGCERKLAYSILFPELHDGGESGWAAMKGTVLHAWLTDLVNAEAETITANLAHEAPRWLTDLELPESTHVVTGGHLDLFDRAEGRVTDWKFPGVSTMKLAAAGRLSNGYYVQTQVYGLGAEMLGERVEKVGLLFSPMCGDDLDAAVYWEWPYDRSVAEAALANATRIEELGRVVPDRVKLLSIMQTKSDFCGSCNLLGKHCDGEQKRYAKPAADPVWPAFERAVAEAS